MSLEDAFEPALAAFVDVLGDDGPRILGVARAELRVIMKRLQKIGEGIASGDIDAETGALLIQMQKNNSVAALALVTNLTGLMIERAVNAALKILKDAAGGTLGALIPG